MKLRIVSLLFLSILLGSCACHQDKEKFSLEKDRKEHKTFVFEDFKTLSQIKIKLTNVDYYTYIDQTDVDVSYIITTFHPLSENESAVYLRLNDADGFEIHTFFAGNVVKDFTGSLKGNLILKPEEYKRLGGAEIFLTVEKAK